MKKILIILLLPVVCWAQPPPLQFQFQPDAFPASIDGVSIPQPWMGGLDYTTPTFYDLDHDGDLDLFCGNNTGYITYFQNTGSAVGSNFIFITDFYDSLVNFSYYGPSPAWDYTNVQFTDMDGDGLPDLLMGGSSSLNCLRLFHNHGTLTQPLFYPPYDTVRTTTGSLVSPGQVALADIDGDGKVDLFVGTYNGYIKYYHNVGTPSSPAFQLIDSNWFNTHTSQGFADPCFGDLDGDGDLDLLIGTGQGHVIYWRNDGSPTSPQMTSVPNFLNINVQKWASPALADIDDDGDLDLFVGRSSSEDQNPAQGSLFFWRNDGTLRNPNFTFVTSNYLGWDSGCFSEPRLVDVDGDGNPDLLSSIGSHLLYYRNTGSPGTPNFAYESSSFGNINVIDLIPWFVDINGDGLLDLFAGTSAIPGPPVMQLYLNHGTPQSPLWQPAPLSLPNVFNQNSVILSPWTADMDGDGDQDLFVSDDNGYLYYFKNVGTPTNYQFQYQTSNWQSLNDGMHFHLFGCFYDIDGDGDLDLFMNSDNYYFFPFEKNLRFYRNHGTAQSPDMVLESNDLFPEQMIWQAHPYVIDIDQDGDGDLFVGDQWGGCRFFRNTTGESQVNPKRPEGPPERMITVLPNPGNSGATISYILDHPQKISLDVFNLLGAKVASLASGLQLPGNYSYTWDASAKASGIYLLRFTTPDQSVSRKITILK